MRFHPVWIAVVLYLCFTLACTFGKNANFSVSTNRGSTNAASESNTSSSSPIKEIHLARDDGKGEPGETAISFGADDETIHCVTTLKEAKAGTRMRFSWFVINAEGAQNEKIKEIEYTTKPSEDVVHGHLTLRQGWPKGTYKVEVYVNDKLDQTMTFAVE